MESFLEFKREIKLDMAGFDEPMEQWEIDFYLERGKTFGLTEEGTSCLKSFIREIQAKGRRK